jgi:hypothetical protein
VDAPEWFAAGRAFERFETEGVLAQGEGTLVAEAALAQPFQVLRLGVVGAVDDAQVLPAADFDAGLDQAATATGEVGVRLDDRTLTAGRGQLLPPGGTGGDGVRVGGVDQDPPGGLDQFGCGVGEPVGDGEVPAVVVVVICAALGGQELEGRQTQPVEAVNGPAVAAVRWPPTARYVPSRTCVLLDVRSCRIG